MSAKKSKKKTSAPAVSKVSVSSQTPRKAFGQITQVGLKAHALAVAHKADLDARLPAGLVDGLESDLDSLGVLLPGVKTTRAASKAAMGDQDTALAQVHERVIAIDAAVRSTPSLKSVRRDWGVGAKVNAKLVKDVLSEADTVIARAAAAPDEAREAGLLQADLDTLAADRAAAATANKTQESTRAGSPQATAARNEAARRVLYAAQKIAAVGVLHYVASPNDRKAFEALKHQAADSKATSEVAGAAGKSAGGAPPPGSAPLSGK